MEKVEVQGLQFLIRPETIDRDVLTEVLEWDTYHVRGLDLGSGPVIVDVGAHIGAFAVLAASLWPGGRVFAYEMDDENFSVLEANVTGKATIHAERCAIVGAKTPAAYRRNPVNSGGHHLLWALTDEARPLPPTKTLAQVMAEHGLDRVDFLKLDCEGAEHEILRGAVADDVLGAVQWIGCEYHNFFGESGEQLVEMLALAGFLVKSRIVNPYCGMLWVKKKSNR